MPAELPAGTVTFLFTDVEGSTRLLREIGSEAYSAILAEHRRILREAFRRHGGVEVDTQGDSFFVAFSTAAAAVTAAAEAQDALEGGPVRVRMGLHTGTPHVTAEGYVGPDVHLGARIAAAGHGGQVLLSQATRRALDHRGHDGTAEVDHGAEHDAPRDFLDLGEHRLKDFDDAEVIYQLGRATFPPLATISNTNLPRPASSFVGREAEVATIVARLGDDARLLTLTGPGGTGKTRLAIEAASQLVPAFRAGVFWVGLAALRDPLLVAPSIARTIGARDGLAGAIGDRDLLLILDNLEQVLAAAPELAALVESCPNLRILVTSRERLRVRGEVELPVQPLADRDAAQLFADRSGLDPDAPDVLALVRALDDLPLAVELAAARAPILSPAGILARLSRRLDLLRGGRDTDPRQQTLRATIEWSYDLLGADARRLLGRLSAFRGGWTLEAAEAAADADLDTLEALIDQSLIRRRGERYSMLETIRDFAEERLRASDELGQILARHAQHYLALAEAAEPSIRRGDPDVLDDLEREHDNIRAAFDRLETAGENASVLRLAGALGRFWYLRGHFVEGWRRLEPALRASAPPSLARARALVAAAIMRLSLGDPRHGRALAEEGLDLSRRFDDPWLTAWAAMIAGNCCGEDGDLAAAIAAYEDALSGFQAIGDGDWTMMTRMNLAYVVGQAGDRTRERALNEENLVEARVRGHRMVEAGTLDQLAWIAHEAAEERAGLALYRGALSIWQELAYPLQIAIDLGRIAYILVLLGQAEPAARLLARSEAMMRDLRSAFAWVDERNDRARGLLRDRLPAPDLARSLAAGEAMSLEEAVALALDAPPPPA